MHGVRRDFVQLIKLCLGLAHLIISSNYLYIAWPSIVQINSTIISIDLSLIGEILIHFSQMSASYIEKTNKLGTNGGLRQLRLDYFLRTMFIFCTSYI